MQKCILSANPTHPVTDCINVADECICAITQLLPAHYEFNLQVENSPGSTHYPGSDNLITGPGSNNMVLPNNPKPVLLNIASCQ